MSDSHSKNGHSAKLKDALIYVVDDEPMLLELASIILEPQGYRLRTFRDPEAALMAFTEAKPRPDLLITDYAMHSMNGLQLIEGFKKLEPDLRIVLVSGTVTEHIFEGSPVKPDRFLAKPYQAAQLTRMVEDLLLK